MSFEFRILFERKVVDEPQTGYPDRHSPDCQPDADCLQYAGHSLPFAHYQPGHYRCSYDRACVNSGADNCSSYFVCSGPDDSGASASADL